VGEELEVAGGEFGVIAGGGRSLNERARVNIRLVGSKKKGLGLK
jgi:hypothetical protein